MRWINVIKTKSGWEKKEVMATIPLNLPAGLYTRRATERVWMDDEIHQRN